MTGEAVCGTVCDEFAKLVEVLERGTAVEFSGGIDVPFLLADTFLLVAVL